MTRPFLRSMAQQLVFFLSCCLFASAIQASQGVAVSTDDTHINLGPQIEWFEDKSNHLTFEQVRYLPKSLFTPGSQYTFNKGYTPSSYWIRFQLDYPEELINSPWLLEIPFPLLDYVALYSPDKNDDYSVIETGDRSPFSQRDFDTTNFVFKLSPEQKNNVYYLHINTMDSLQLPLYLWHVDHFPKHSAHATGLQGLYFGIMIVMLFYNLFIYLSVRERSYLYYIAYIGTFTIFQASIQGYSFQYFWPNSTTWANINIPFLGVLSLFFASLFARSILNTQSLNPKFDKALVLIAGVLFLTLPLVLFASYTVGVITALFTTFIFFNLVLVTAFLAALQKNRTAKIFVVAWAIFLISGAISLLGAMNFLPIEFASQTALQIGSAIEVILLSIALADRINLIQKEKAEIEARSREVLLEANIQLENSNRLKDEFIATISHEIRTPMNGVLGSAQLLLDTPLNEEQSLYIDTINQSGKTLLEILNNILDYSKIEANKLQIELSEFELEDIINECSESFSVIARQNSVKLFVRIHKDAPKRIVSDPVRFKQVLLNLISNAFKFTTQGQVVVHVRMSRTSSKHLCIEVEDSGCGLTGEQQDSLFKPFVQLDSSSTREKGGTGLGLAISKKLTRLMQGEIGVHSQLGEGSTFWFTAKIKIIEESNNDIFLNNKKVCLFLSSRYQESLIKDQLKQWDLHIASHHLLEFDHDACIISDNTKVRELLDFGIPAKNILVISDTPQKIVSATHIIMSPITPQKLRHELQATQSLSLDKINASGEVETPDFSHLKVLAVDDNKVNRMIIKKMLMKYGIEADIAVGGIEAMDFIQEQEKRYNLILMDIEMPGKDGYQTTIDIRNFEQAYYLETSKIVAISAHSMKESREKALSSGMDDFLNKPIDQRLLIDVLASCQPKTETLPN